MVARLVADLSRLIRNAMPIERQDEQPLEAAGPQWIR
jgi:hypothetical protein